MEVNLYILLWEKWDVLAVGMDIFDMVCVCSLFFVFFSSGHVHKALSQWCYIVMPFQGLIPSERELEKDRER